MITPILVNYSPKYLPKTKIPLSVRLHSFFRICENCEKFDFSVKVNHRNTAYCEDYKNYAAFCEKCNENDWNAWQELWDEYNLSRF